MPKSQVPLCDLAQHMERELCRVQPTLQPDLFQQAITPFYQGHQESFTSIRLTEMASLTHQREVGMFSLPFSSLCTVRVIRCFCCFSGALRHQLLLLPQLWRHFTDHQLLFQPQPLHKTNERNNGGGGGSDRETELGVSALHKNLNQQFKNGSTLLAQSCMNGKCEATATVQKLKNNVQPLTFREVQRQIKIGIPCSVL